MPTKATITIYFLSYNLKITQPWNSKFKKKMKNEYQQQQQQNNIRITKKSIILPRCWYSTNKAASKSNTSWELCKKFAQFCCWFWFFCFKQIVNNFVLFFVGFVLHQICHSIVPSFCDLLHCRNFYFRVACKFYI